MRKTLGTHILIEMFDCDPMVLKSEEYVKGVMTEAAHKSNAKVVDTFFHQFKPYGVSGVVVIEESHFTIHTWPEYSFAAVDLFFCSENVDIDTAIRILKEGFSPQRMAALEIKRGKVSHDVDIPSEVSLISTQPLSNI